MRVRDDPARQVVEPGDPVLNGLRKTELPLSPAIRTGDFVFVSGMAAIDPATGDRMPGTVAAETRQILTDIALSAGMAGSSLAKVVKVNALIYSMLEYENMNAVYREFFPTDPPAPDGVRGRADRRPQGRDRMRGPGLNSRA